MNLISTMVNAVSLRTLLIVAAVRTRIDDRILRPGARLPSIRQFAEQHGVSRFTVVEAYDRLVAVGYLQSRRGSGFYVASRAQPARAIGGGDRHHVRRARQEGAQMQAAVGAGARPEACQVGQAGRAGRRHAQPTRDQGRIGDHAAAHVLRPARRRQAPAAASVRTGRAGRRRWGGSGGGPVAVVYPEAVWYTYVDEHDIDEIVESHLRDGQVVERLLTPPTVGR
mgnify:CR=1 FL=1